MPPVRHVVSPAIQRRSGGKLVLLFHFDQGKVWLLKETSEGEDRTVRTLLASLFGKEWISVSTRLMMMVVVFKSYFLTAHWLSLRMSKKI